MHLLALEGVRRPIDLLCINTIVFRYMLCLYIYIMFNSFYLELPILTVYREDI